MVMHTEFHLDVTKHSVWQIKKLRLQGAAFLAHARNTELSTRHPSGSESKADVSIHYTPTSLALK